MAGVKTIPVAVAYARPDRQVVIPVDAPEGATLEQAIALAQLQKQFPEIDLNTCKVGIFSRISPLSTVLRAGDRVEIYRPLSAAGALRQRCVARTQADAV